MTKNSDVISADIMESLKKDMSRLTELAEQNHRELVTMGTSVAILMNEREYFKERLTRHKAEQSEINKKLYDGIYAHDQIIYGKGDGMSIVNTINKIEGFIKEQNKKKAYDSNKWRDLVFAVIQVMVIGVLIMVAKQLGIHSIG